MNRKAFTLVELLVVIAIIGILIGMMVPAVQSARESSRRATCMNNIKQLGLGVLQYQAANGKFPPAMTLPFSDNPNTTYNWGPNWVILTLPFLDGNALYNQFNPRSLTLPTATSTVVVPISDSTNAVARSTTLSVMLCPTDVWNKNAYQPGPTRPNDGPNWARGNYAANGSVQQLSSNGDGMQDADWTTIYWRGVMGCNTSLSLDQVKDGAACTILLAEIRAGLTPSDNRGIWAMGAVGPSALWGDGVTDDQGPDNPSEYADDVADCDNLTNSLGNTYMTQERMGCYSGNGNDQATARSRHLGGVNSVFCDGSVHFISDFIDSNPGWSINSAADLHVWEKLLVSSDGMLLDQSMWEATH